VDVGQVEAALENREVVEHGLFVGRQEVVGPLDGRLKRLLTLAGSTSTAGQQPEAVIEAVADLGDAHRAGARRGQLDGQGDPVESLADLGDDRFGVAVGIEAVSGGVGPLDEQAHGGRVDAEFERRHPPRVLSLHLERLSARGQDAELGSALEHGVDQVGGFVEHVLAVVDHHKGATGREVSGDLVGSG